MQQTCSAPSRRPWRTMKALQSDRAEQQQCRRCHRTGPPCRRAFAIATRVGGAAMQQQSVADAEAQHSERFQGIDWASNQEMDTDNEVSDEEQQRLNGQSTWSPQNTRHIDENDPARHSYHRIMMKHAAQGDYIDVEVIMEEMEDSGLEPGPFAFHAQIFALVKAEQPDAGLEVMREMHTEGLKPIAQSYIAMIHGFMRAGKTEEAQRMFHSLRDSGHDAYTGWLAITNQLFAAGQEAAARELVATRQPEWLPDADLYEQLIESVCSNTEGKSFSYMLSAPHSAGDSNTDDAQIVEALQILQEMQARIEPELRHIHPILEACALHGSASSAEKLIKQMTSRQLQLPSPDGHCMECLAKAHIQSGRGELRKGLKTVLALLHTAKLPVTRRIRALLVEGSLLESDLQGALTYFHGLRPAGRMANSVPDRVLNDLLTKLSAASMPAELLRTLILMKSDFMRLPPVDSDSSGRSFLSLWLANRHLSAPASAPAAGFEGVMVQPETKAKENVTEVDGVRILDGRYAMSAEGKVLSPSSQNMAQLKAELTARSLSIEGKRDVLKRRVMVLPLGTDPRKSHCLSCPQAARSAEPPDMAKEIRKKEAQTDAKRKKQREKEAAAGKGPEAQPAGADQDNKSKIRIMTYGSGVGKVKEEFEAVVEDEEEGVIDEAEDDNAVDPMQPSNAATPLDDEADYIVSDGNSAEDLLDDSNDYTGDLPAPPISVSTPPVQRLPSNEDSGAAVALQILALCIDLFGSATAQDYEQMLQAAEAEHNPLVARDLAGSWHAVIESAFDQDTVSQMYNRAARVCLEGEAVAHAANVLQQANQRGLELESELQNEIQQQHKDMLHQQQQQQKDQQQPIGS